MFTNGILNPASSQSRQPRGIVLINNMPVMWTDIEVTTTTFYMSDSFRIEIPLNQQPIPFNFDYWVSTPKFTVKIYIGFPNDPSIFTTQDLDLIILGDADEVEVDPLGARVLLSGRDYTSKFIDIKTTEKFPGKTSSYIVTQFANTAGLNPVVTPTTTVVGTFYDTQQTLLSRTVTQWDLMTFLAQQENFVLFVQKDNLVFEPRPNDSKNPYILTYQPPTIIQSSPVFNGMALGITRYMTLAKDVKVTVKSPYNSKTGKAFYVTVTSTHKSRAYLHGVPPPSSEVQKYSYIIPGLTPEQATQKANQLLRDITLHEVNLTASVPGENTLQKDSLIKLQGTGTSADQFYYVDQVVRYLSVNGYNMTISAKNHSVDSEVTI